MKSIIHMTIIAKSWPIKFVMKFLIGILRTYLTSR
jgi:hypothetical protein